jgi:acyl-CoA reductase-like NAD-dependent aldehyde dehydrogenase
MQPPLNDLQRRARGQRGGRYCEDAGAAVEAVQAAFLGWSAMPSAERRRPLERAGDLLMERQA